MTLARDDRVAFVRAVDTVVAAVGDEPVPPTDGAQALQGMTIGVYTHSTVGRDLLLQILERLGAQVVELGRSEAFIPVDTEAVSDDMQAQLLGWAAAQNLDAIVSLDGDGELALLLGGEASQATRKDLASLREELLEKVDILVVDRLTLSDA